MPYPNLSSSPMTPQEDPASIKSRQASLEKFLSFCHRRRYPPKSDIIFPGDPADTLYYIAEGSVSVIMEDEEGREIVLAYVNKGEFIGEIGLFITTESRGVLVRSRTTCILAEVGYARLHQLFNGELAEQHAEILFLLGAHLSNRLLQTSRKVGDLAFLDVTGRIASTLDRLCKEPDAMTHPDGMQIRITRQEIGRIVGCSREMAGRVLKALEEQELVTVKGKTIVVLGAR